MTGERRLAAAEKQAEALKLRKAGLDFRRIAQQLGYAGPGPAHKAVMSALKATVREPADELRTLEVERLDAMLLGIWAKATQGGTLAIDRALKIMERRAALLGLDAPKRQELTGKDGGPIELVRAMAARAAAEEGLDPSAVVAAAERIMAEARG